MRDDVVANIAYAASENRRQSGPNGKHDRERVTYCTTKEHVRSVYQGGTLGSRTLTLPKMRLHEKRNDLVLSESNKYRSMAALQH